jgi:3-deoxy-D-manno-octulosonic-acid transferase
VKWFIYNLLFGVVWVFLLPGFLLRMFRRGGYAARMGDRFALYPAEVMAKLRSARTVSPASADKLDPSGHAIPAPTEWVWIHAVSVGEVQVAGQLMREWRKAEPSVKFCFSTTSSTGWKMAEREVSEQDVLIYNPLDFPNFVKSALNVVRPRTIVLTESEIWPVFIRAAAKRAIPLFLVNARVSDRSAPRYRLARCFFKDVFGCFTKIFAQSDLDSSRLVAAGAPADVVEVTGSFKFDVARRNPKKEGELREWLSGAKGRILLGGSTWPGEDEVLLRIVKTLDNATLVIAPRHFEKADTVEANIRRAGFGCVRRSRGDSPSSADGGQVYLADTTGELMGLYGIADVVFVGKSLCEHGSQNMIEPCLCGKPTFVGPFTENFRPVMSDLLESDAIVQVSDEKGLLDGISRIWRNDGEAKSLGERATAAVLKRQGVVEKCVSEIRGVL